MGRSEIESRSDRSSIYLRPGSIHPTESNWSNPDSSADAQTLQSQSSLNFYNLTNSQFSSRAQSIASTQNYPASGEDEYGREDADTRTLKGGAAESKSRRFFFGSSQRSNTKKIDVGRWVQYMSRGRTPSSMEDAGPVGTAQNPPRSESFFFAKNSEKIDTTSIRRSQPTENATRTIKSGDMRNIPINQEDVVPDRLRNIGARYEEQENAILKTLERSGYRNQETLALDDTYKMAYRNHKQTQDPFELIGKARLPNQPSTSSYRPKGHAKRPNNIKSSFSRGRWMIADGNGFSPPILSGLDIFSDIIEQMANLKGRENESGNDSLYLERIGEELCSAVISRSVDTAMTAHLQEIGGAAATHSALIQSSLKMIKKKRYRVAMWHLFDDLSILGKIWSLLTRYLGPNNQVKNDLPEWLLSMRREQIPKLYMCKTEIFLLLAYITLNLDDHPWTFTYLNMALESHPSFAGRLTIALLQGMMVVTPGDFYGQHFITRADGHLESCVSDNLLLWILRICENERIKICQVNSEYPDIGPKQHHLKKQICFRLCGVLTTIFSYFFISNGLQGSSMDRYVSQAYSSIRSMVDLPTSDPPQSPQHRVHETHIKDFIECLHDLYVSNEFEIPLDWIAVDVWNCSHFFGRPTNLFAVQSKSREAPERKLGVDIESKSLDEPGNIVASFRFGFVGYAEDFDRRFSGDDSEVCACEAGSCVIFTFGPALVNQTTQTSQWFAPNYHIYNPIMACGSAHQLVQHVYRRSWWPFPAVDNPTPLMRCILLMNVRGAMNRVRKSGTDEVNWFMGSIVQAEYTEEYQADLGLWLIEILLFLGADISKIHLSEMVRLRGIGVTDPKDKSPQSRVYRRLAKLVN